MSTPATTIPVHRYNNRTGTTPSASSQKPQNLQHHNLKAHQNNSMTSMDRPQPSTPPRTPQKTKFQPGPNGGPSGVESATKSKSKGRSRPKNVTTSPAPATRTDQNTSPLPGAYSSMPASAKPLATPTTAAYAGPTFHASPAPSALPIPSFYSKSVPDSPGDSGFKSRQEQMLSGKDRNSPTTAIGLSTTAQLDREESPLDFFFKADREEKARARSTSTSGTGPFVPPPEQSPISARAGSAGQNHRSRGYPARGPAGGMFPMELDGNSSPEQTYGAPFSTPYKDRIAAARSNSYESQQFRRSQSTSDKSDALKAFLFSGRQNSGMPMNSAQAGSFNTFETQHSFPAVSGTQNASAPFPYASHNMRGQQTSLPRNGDKTPVQNTSKAGKRSSGLRQEVEITPTRTPTGGRNESGYPPPPMQSFTPSHAPKTGQPPSIQNAACSTQHQAFGSPSSNNKGANDLQFMEESLRRILKLEPVYNNNT
jgi:hypothetical protein